MVKKNEKMKPSEITPGIKNTKDDNSSNKPVKSQKAQEKKLSSFPIVGIGASAGGLTTFRRKGTSIAHWIFSSNLWPRKINPLALFFPVLAMTAP